MTPSYQAQLDAMTWNTWGFWVLVACCMGLLLIKELSDPSIHWIGMWSVVRIWLGGFVYALIAYYAVEFFIKGFINAM